MKQPLLILGIESSCDDTSAAIIKDTTIFSNVTANQDVHKAYGGVVPELASRAHQQNIVPTVQQAFKKANIRPQQLDAIAYTAGPGLLGSLLVGSSFAKGLAIGLNIPLIEVNHMRAHILAHLITSKDNQTIPSFPFLCLTVSGGHTQIVKVVSPLKMEVIGKTIDDAAGEAFDKAAKIMGIEYPGGPLIDKYSQLGNPLAFQFNKPKIKDLDFSFSGLKTSFLYFLRNKVKNEPDFVKNNLNDLCASIQHTIVAILIAKLRTASLQTGIKTLALAGGVSANSLLRKQAQLLSDELNGNCFIPPFDYCTDNAAMIAITGYYHFLNNDFTNLKEMAKARLKL